LISKYWRGEKRLCYAKFCIAFNVWRYCTVTLSLNFQSVSLWGEKEKVNSKEGFVTRRSVTVHDIAYVRWLSNSWWLGPHFTPAHQTVNHSCHHAFTGVHDHIVWTAKTDLCFTIDIRLSIMVYGCNIARKDR